MEELENLTKMGSYIEKNEFLSNFCVLSPDLDITFSFVTNGKIFNSSLEDLQNRLCVE